MLTGIDAIWDELEDIRRSAVAEIDRVDRKDLGQVLTPVPIARLLAEQFTRWHGNVELLDPGSGAGTLGAVAALNALTGVEPPTSVRLQAWEIDPQLVARTKQSLALVSEQFDKAGVPFEAEVRHEDFLATAVDRSCGLSAGVPTATHAILNPPYAKLSTNSQERALAERLGAPVPNLYAAFMLAVSALLKFGGELVAITPRSFCNGPYFKRFRKALLQRNILSLIRVFESRSCTFSDQAVLQENIVSHLIRGQVQPSMIRVQVGDPGSVVRERVVSPDEVVFPGDGDAYIHVAESEIAANAAIIMNELPETMTTIGVNVSTGPVVDFRVKHCLSYEYRPDSVPLLYPSTVKSSGVSWPGSRGKPIAIADVKATSSLLTLRGDYVLIKRFSSKEESRRIIAGPLISEALPKCSKFGIENHINYLHRQGKPLNRSLAIGLSAFLNHNLVDIYFRSFSGHTQVNAADIRRLRIPDQATLEKFGSSSHPHEACHKWLSSFALACGISDIGEESRLVQTSAVS